MIRVLLADDHAAVRAGLRAMLESADDIEVMGDCADGTEAVRVARETSPDVVLMDVQMPGLDGIAATRQVVAIGGIRVIVLTTFGIDRYVDEALAAGASAFLLKTISTVGLIDAIRRVVAGDAVLAPEVTRGVIERLTQRATPGTTPGRTPSGFPRAAAQVGSLTAREREVLDCLGDGLSNGEIAARLVISEATAKTHVSRVLVKLGLPSRVQAALVRQGLSPG